MSQSTRQFGAAWLVFFPYLVLAAGCGQTPVAQQTPLPKGPAEPGEVKLSNPKATYRDPTTVMFEVKYRFTKGRPSMYYSLEISFPGHPNHRVKKIESWELQQEGVIKDGVELSEPGAKSFEIYMSEASSPQGGFKKISNVVSGPIK
jgi:hypothetical protein